MVLDHVRLAGHVDGDDDKTGLSLREAWMIYAWLDVFITSPRDPVIDFHKSPAQNSPLLS